MTGDTDRLRAALGARAASVPVPDPDALGVLRQRALIARVRTLTAVSAAVLLVAGVAALVGTAPEPTSTTTVDMAGGGPARQGADDVAATTSMASTTMTSPAGGGPAGTGDDGDTGAGSGRPKVDLGGGSSPPTTAIGPVDQPPDEAPTELTYAMAAPGHWSYRVTSEGPGGVLGGRSGYDDAEALVCVRPPQGRAQRIEGASLYASVVTAATREIGDGVGLRELDMSAPVGSTRRFVAPAGAFDVPPRQAWGTPSTFSMTSTDGKAQLRVTVRAEGMEEVAIPGELHDTYVRTVRVRTVLERSGDQVVTTDMTTWWGVDLGLPVRIHESSKGTAADGSAVDQWAETILADDAPADVRSVPDDCRG